MMRSPIRYPAITILCFALLLSVLMPKALHAENALPAAVKKQLDVPVEEMGSSTYRKFGFSVYRATLWAPDGIWEAEDPYVLVLRYTRSLSKDTVIDNILDNIRDQHVADDATFATWEKKIRDTLPAVQDGDTMIGVAIPGDKTLLFLNSKKIAEIHDQALGQAFFNIWLGPQADGDLRADLLKSSDGDSK